MLFELIYDALRDAGVEHAQLRNHYAETVTNALVTGYVRVPQGHPWHGLDYDADVLDVGVHGGLTFARPDADCGKGGADDAWWLGFDCAHSGDAPDPRLMSGEQIAHELAMERRGLGSMRRYDTVRSTEYVAAECKRLCEQAAAVTS